MQINYRTIIFKDFTRVRRSIEFLMANFLVATTETVGKFGSGIKGYDRLQSLYLLKIGNGGWFWWWGMPEYIYSVHV